MNTTMTTDEITTIVDANKDAYADVLLTDGTTFEGRIVSVNSKGLNLKDADGKVISRSLSRVQWIELADAELDALVSELDGATTAELADVFGIAAKELRVHLRALGMGVGKGHRYHLTADQIAVVKHALTAV